MAEAERDEARPKVGIIFTGGTVDSLGHDRLDLAWYLEANRKLSPAELLAAVPEIAGIAEIVEIPFRRMASHALVDRDWLELLNKAHAVLADETIAGLVIMHGTNTLEETAYFLGLALNTDKPVVLTGAMRPASAISADGYLNLVNAVRVAGAPQSRGQGCLVMLNDTIFAARDVTKTSTYRVQAFQSRDVGPVGYADGDGQVVYYARTLRPHTTATEFDVSGLSSLPRVDVVVSYVGADGVMIEAAARAGAKGVVSAATGAGRPTPAEDEAFDKAHRETGMIMCLSSRIASGRVVRSPGLKARGFVASDNLPPWKARILLALALTRTDDADEVQRMFDTY